MSSSVKNYSLSSNKLLGLMAVSIMQTRALDYNGNIMILICFNILIFVQILQ